MSIKWFQDPDRLHISPAMGVSNFVMGMHDLTWMVHKFIYNLVLLLSPPWFATDCPKKLF